MAASMTRLSIRVALAMVVSLCGFAAPRSLTWSATDHGPQIGVDGPTASRTSSAGSPWQSARIDRSQSKGVRNVTFRIVEAGSGGTVRVGLANGVVRMRDYVGADRDGVSYGSNGEIAAAGTKPSPPLAPFGTGDVVGMIADLDAKTVRFNRNGGTFSAAVDISSLGPDVFVAVSFHADTGATAPAVRIETSSWSDPENPALVIVAHGDSMTLAGGVKKIWVQRLAEKLEENRFGHALWTKAGINGASWSFAWLDSGYPHTLTEDAPLRVDPLRTTSIPSWLIVFAGTNGLAMALNSPSDEYAALQRYLRARLAAGWTPSRIIVCTMLPRTGVPETTRGAYNAAIVADAGGIGYRVARLDLDPNIGAAGQVSNSTWFLDGIHPTDAGHGAIAQIVYEVIRASSSRGR
jgi:lysophospholipase L1-like esterase